MTSSTITDVTIILHLLILVSGLFNSCVLAADPLEKVLEELRTEWKKAFVGKETDLSERRLNSFTESLRADEKFKQLELNPPLTKMGAIMLVALNKEGAYQRHMKILQDHDKPPGKTDSTQDKENVITQMEKEDDELKYHVKIVFSIATIKFRKAETVAENFIRSLVENAHGHKIMEMTGFDWNDTNVYVFFEFWSWYIEHQLTALRNGWTNKEYKDVTLGHFDVHNKSKELGRGNYGVVYKVTRNNDRKEFAMKDMIVQDVFHKYKDWPTRKRKVDHMLNEVDVLRDIESDFTIDMVGFDIEKEPHTKKYSIVTFMEYASGGELNKYIDWWRERRKAITGMDHLAIPEEVARDLFAHLAKALETLHKAGIGNRDIKPENILIDGYGRAKLTDFGLAKRFNGVDDHIFGVGSPPYQAPELVKEGDTHNQLVDWWSLTAVLYSALTGCSAFGHENIETEILTSPVNLYNAGRAGFQPVA
ncbi:protein kinase domain-containing protein [Ditylenchus destructor]|uniref:Protein kinase domain-containing protein n=1 Tax=Ditylenchus destructor TaxID=166010 RepID=A0AAD4MKK6_9BILA|nr:protein kinase domain-containing protein [Ditylenchus destructor]